jgi:transcriptional regulator with XRE-family HTH domain
MKNKTVQLGEKIKELRKALRLSQTAFGKKIGYTRSAVAQYESNDITPPVSVLKKISELAGKTLQYFFDNSINISGGGTNKNIVGQNNINEVSKIALLEKDIEILKLQMELLKKDKKK